MLCAIGRSRCSGSKTARAHIRGAARVTPPARPGTGRRAGHEAGHQMVRNAAPASLTLRPGEEQGTWPALRDLAVLLAAEAGGLARRLARPTADAAGELVRGMNCYRSNLIAGHDTRPIDIERALRADLATEPRRRNLQLEAAAHIGVQTEIAARQSGSVSGEQAHGPRITPDRRPGRAGRRAASRGRGNAARACPRRGRRRHWPPSRR